MLAAKLVKKWDVLSVSELDKVSAEASGQISDVNWGKETAVVWGEVLVLKLGKT